MATYVLKGLGSYRIREITTQRLDGFVKSLKANHGPSVAKSARVILSGMFRLAVRFGAATTNPVRDVGTIKMESRAARALSADELRGILDATRSSQFVLNPSNKVTPRQALSQYCTAADLTDVVTMFAATGAAFPKCWASAGKISISQQKRSQSQARLTAFRDKA